MNAIELAMNADNIARAFVVESIMRDRRASKATGTKSGSMGFWDTPRLSVDLNLTHEANGTVTYEGIATTSEMNMWDTTRAKGNVSGNFDPSDKSERERLRKFATHRGLSCWY